MPVGSLLPRVLKHGRIEFVPIVQDRQPITTGKRHAGCPGHRKEELLGFHVELVIETVTGRRLRRGKQIADDGHGTQARSPGPTIGDGGAEAEDEPGPPRPEERTRARPPRRHTFSWTVPGIERDATAPPSWQSSATPAARLTERGRCDLPHPNGSSTPGAQG